MQKLRMRILNCCFQNAILVYTILHPAYSHIGEGKAYKAYEILKDCQNSQNRYKFALTCLKLNKLQEAERALLNKKNPKT
jgi:hypothetical protein